LLASGYNPKRLPAMLTPKPRGAILPLGGVEGWVSRVTVAGAHEFREDRRHRQGGGVAPLTPASPADLPPLSSLIADEPFWRYPVATLAGEGVTHLRVWLTNGPGPGHLAVVTETGLAASVTESAGHIWAELARRYGSPVVLLEHYPAPDASEGMETLDLVRIGADGSPHWSRVWPTPEDNPRHAGLELWMAAYGYQIVSRPAGAFDWCQDEGD
jgi:hypothetical protein